MAFGKIILLCIFCFNSCFLFAQFHYSISANFIEEFTDGKNINSVSKGFVNYNINTDTLKTTLVYPYFDTIKTAISPTSILYLALNGNLLSFGAESFNYVINNVSSVGENVYVEYILPNKYNKTKDAINKIIVSQKNNRANAVALLDSLDKPISKFFYYNYISVDGIDFPTQIINVSYIGGEFYTKTIYSNVFIDDKPCKAILDTLNNIDIVITDLLKPISNNLNCYQQSNIILRGLFAFYRRVVSTQDIQTCSFYPSCSQYSFQTFSKNGFFYGFADTFDRLLRCNGINKKDYKYIDSLHKLEDYPITK